jgi:putative oxidoreductase
MLSKITAGDEPKSIAADLAVTLGVAEFLRHGADPLFSREGPSKELALVYLAAAVAFLLAGSGRFGVDALLRRRRSAE